MCGIAGFIDSSSRTGRVELEELARSMCGRLSHRGPDDEGVWADPASGVVLGHRRLSILDLSPGGHQPMWSACGRYCIVFNGEIYNFRALRRELEGAGHRFRGTSDTEVMLAAIGEWGLDRALRQFNGMFAFALWDAKERRLDLARDRLGEKPLYYGRAGRVFLFGSELKALRAHPEFGASIDRKALALYLRYGYVPGPHSIFEGIFKLPPAHRLTIEAGGCLQYGAPVPYWSARSVAEGGGARGLKGSAEELTDEFDALMRDAVAIRMEADVPLGAFLSGGIDSSAVVALMQAQSPRPVKTFTIGFKEQGHDEAPFAAAVARHLGTDHSELYVTGSDAMNVIPSLPVLYDEPFSDSSQIPTFLISKLARSAVTVALTGDGADEIFGGYGRYRRAWQVWSAINWAPAAARRPVAFAMKSVRRSAHPITSRLPGRNWEVLERRAMRLEHYVSCTRAEAMYPNLMSCWTDPASVALCGREPASVLTDSGSWADLPDVPSQLMYLDTITYLPDDILVKVDRAAMGVSLETRVPFLDPRVVEFAWRLPMAQRTNRRTGKVLLRRLLCRYVPEALVERPKMGFTVPLHSWLRGPLRAWAEELLDERRLRREGFLNVAAVRRTWQEHATGAANWKERIWNVLMFQAWLEQLQAAPACAVSGPQLDGIAS
jgi:asparagine synthase (glutamine-hydrolysing)